MSYYSEMKKLKEISKKIGDYAYIAGGFYKDIINEVKPKDIDIFMRKASEYHLEKVLEILKEETGESVIEKEVSYQIGIFEVIKPKTICNRHLFGEPEELVKTFDVDIARVYIEEGFVESTDFYYLEELQEKIKRKEFTLYKFEGDEERSAERGKRYESYGYKMVKEVLLPPVISGSSTTGGYE